jgi:hypothetical protein
MAHAIESNLLNAHLLSPARRSVPSEHEYSGNKKSTERTIIEARSFQLNQHDLQYTVTNNSIKVYVQTHNRSSAV